MIINFQKLDNKFTDYVPLKDDKFKRTSKIKKIWGSVKYKFFPEKF